MSERIRVVSTFTPIVWVMHPARIDLSTAGRFGSFEYVNDHYVYADQIRPDGSLPAEQQKNMEEAAADFNPVTDFLLIAGDHLQIVAFAALLGKRWGTFKVLRYSNSSQSYFEAKITTGAAPPP
jgi:hypothetical protein